MALEHLLGPIVTVTISKVISLATEQINLGIGFKKELESFRTTLSMIKDLLHHAEQNGATDAPGMKTWLKELRKIADEAAAVMDEIAYETLRGKVAAGKPKPKQVSNLFCFCSPVIGLLGMANRIKEVNTALDKLYKKAAGFGFQQMLANTNETKHRDLVPQTDSLLGNASEVIGRDVDVRNLVSLLIDSSKFDQPLGVVSIVGVGGLGKTTLAKLVRHNEKIQGHFSKIMWVCVSEKFEVGSILGEMLQYLTRRSDITHQDTVVQIIKEELQDKNYLLVLDDVWNEDGPKWESLRNCLMGITKSVGSSRVLVTTRLQSVATITRSVCGSIQKLEVDACWSIIKQKAFGSSLVPPELEAIGQKIAMKCRGVPLVAKSIGGILYNYRNEDDWLSIEKKFDATGDDGVLQALKLSFDRLPIPALKQCFVFCSIFPKYVVMEKEMLIQLWMAEGFLETLHSCLELEDVGDNYFKDLVSYSFFQDVERDYYGSIVSCKMHDLMHDLAKSISKSEILVLEEEHNNQSDFGDIRHLNLLSAPSMTPTKTMKDFQKLHSLILKVDNSCDTSINFKNLLALSFCGVDISELPSFLGKLKRLRYLDISETKIKEIPKFISKLYLLQTFKFMKCRFLEKSFEDIENLVGLKHIYYDEKKHMPAGIGSLTCLQTLELFVVGHRRGYQIQALEHLSQLRGGLRICNLENIRNGEEAKRANLCKKNALVELTLEFGWTLSLDQLKHHYNILEGLEPHSNLRGLILRYYGGEKCPSWMSNSVGTVGGLTCLRNLSRLEFFNCPHLESIPSLSLSKKAELQIRRCNILKSIEDSLIQRLIIKDCAVLALLRFGPLTMMHLQVIHIEKCDKLETLQMVSSLPCLEVLRLKSCYNLKIIEGESSSSLTSLKDLNISNCHALTSIPSLDGLVSLERISISSCLRLKIIEGEKLSSCTSLRELSITYCHALMSIPSLDGLLSLETINISCCSKLKSIKKEGLSLSSRLKKLDVSYWHALTSLSILHDLSCLVQIHIVNCKLLKSMSGTSLSSATHLRELSIHSCPALISIPSLDGLLSLERISIMDCQQLKSIGGESLSTSTCLKELTLWNCPALTYIPSLHGLASFTGLKELSISYCPAVASVPSLHGLSSLERIWISNFEQCNAFEDNFSFSMCLKDLSIESCPSLASIPSLDGLSSLEFLSIRDCGGLTRLPNGLSSLLNLTELELGGFSEDMEEFLDLSFIQHLHCSLEYLTLVGWEKLKHLPGHVQCLTALIDLTIQKFDGLEALPDWLENLPSLKFLCIRDCGGLTRLPNGLSSLLHLTRLELGGFSENMEEFPDLSFIKHLHRSLEYLTLVGWEKLKHLPHQIQCLTALVELNIRKFDGLGALPDWLGNLSSLQWLYIQDCKSLMHMPSREAIQWLSSLDISNCPELEARCASESGSEWDKISHIPKVTIKSNQQKRNSDSETDIGTTSSFATHDQQGDIIVTNNDDEQESETSAAASRNAQHSELTVASDDDNDDQQILVSVADDDDQQILVSAADGDDQQSRLTAVNDETESIKTGAAALDDGQSG